jgi:glutathione synthase
MLSLLKAKNPHIFFVNDPASLRDHVEKLLPITLDLPMPPTIISGDYSSICAFLNEHKTIVLKSIYGFGGGDVIKVSSDDQNKVEAFLKKQNSLQVIAQKFLDEIYQGDKRVIVCDGQVLGCVGRMPAENSFLTNGRMGGNPHKATLNINELHFCTEIALKLKDKNIFLAGIDLIGSYVTEINITSPTLLVALTRHAGLDPLKKLVDKMIERVTDSGQ